MHFAVFIKTFHFIVKYFALINASWNFCCKNFESKQKFVFKRNAENRDMLYVSVKNLRDLYVNLIRMQEREREREREREKNLILYYRCH